MPRRTRGELAAFSGHTKPAWTGQSAIDQGSKVATASALATRLAKTELCRYAKKGCRNGSNCPFAHAPEELRDRPDLRKTMICPAWLQGRCDRSECSHAHGEDELRMVENAFPRSRHGWASDDSTPTPHRDSGVTAAPRQRDGEQTAAGRATALCLHGAFVTECAHGSVATSSHLSIPVLGPSQRPPSFASFPTMVPYNVMRTDIVPLMSQSSEAREMLNRLPPGIRAQLVLSADIQRLLMESRPEFYEE